MLIDKRLNTLRRFALFLILLMYLQLMHLESVHVKICLYCTEKSIKKRLRQGVVSYMAADEGFEPSKWWIQSPLPYRLANPQLHFLL